MDNETFVAELVALRTLVVAMYSLDLERQLIAERFKLFHSQLPGAVPLHRESDAAINLAHKRLLDQISTQGFSL